MAAKKPKALKVYRTAIGFHDAYVAAPSKKAALAAWGTTKDLFARHAAEQVTDAALIAGPLARPGEVIKRARGTDEEQIAALDTTPARSRGVRKKAAKATPRPSRDRLDRADQALAESERRQDWATAKLRREEQALAERRQALEADQAAEREALQGEVDAARAEHDAALRAWRAAATE